MRTRPQLSHLLSRRARAPGPPGGDPRPALGLWGPDARTHDTRAASTGSPQFDTVRAHALAGGRLRVPVDRDTFHHLGATLTAAARWYHPAAESIAEYSPRPAWRATDLLLGWLEGTRFAVAGLPITVEPPDPELLALLTAVARVAAPENEGVVLRLLGALTGGVFRGPHTFHLDVANSCNVNCKYCWFHSPLAQDRADAADFDKSWRHQVVDWDVFTRLAEDLEALGTCEDVLLSGKGEPLLHPRILDMIEVLKQRRLRVSLFTNGLLVVPRVSRHVVQHGLDLLYVSLSSASHQVYEAIHPGHPARELDEVQSNVSWLDRHRLECGVRRPEIMMVDVVNSHNAHEILDFYEMSRDLGADHVRFQLVHVQPYNRELRLSADQVERVRRDLLEAHSRELAGGPHIVQNIDYQLSTLDVETGNWGHNRLPGEGCYVGWTFSRSWTNGDISFCCSPKVIDNLTATRFRDVWAGPEYGAFRNAARDLARQGDLRFRNGAALLGDHCNGCPNYEGIDRLASDLHRHGLARFVRGTEATRLGPAPA